MASNTCACVGRASVSPKRPSLYGPSRIHGPLGKLDSQFCSISGRKDWYTCLLLHLTASCPPT